MDLLCQPDSTTFTVTLLLTVAQFSLAVQQNTLVGCLMTSVLLGAPLAHGLYMMNQEFCYNLCFGASFFDRWCGIFSNFAAGLPYSELLRLSETEQLVHPRPVIVYQQFGWKQKLGHALAQPVQWWLRLIYERRAPVNKFVIWNVFLQSVIMSILFFWFHVYTVIYLLFSTYLGLCPVHPIAAHLLPSSDHGMFNLLTFNAGYKRQPRVPWTRLPMWYQMAHGSVSTPGLHAWRKFWFS